METLKDVLFQGWLGNLIGIVGLVGSYVFYRLSIKTVALSAVRRSRFVVGGNAPLSKGIEIRVNGIVVPRVTYSVVLIWNAGREMISKERLSANDPLRVLISDDGELLTATVDHQTRIASQFKVDRFSEHEIRCDFDFLEPGDAARIDVLHSGSSVRVAGTIKGMAGDVRDETTAYPKRAERIGYIVIGIFTTATTSLMAFEVISVNAFALSLPLGFVVAGAIVQVWRKRPLNALVFEVIQPR